MEKSCKYSITMLCVVRQTCSKPWLEQAMVGVKEIGTCLILLGTIGSIMFLVAYIRLD